MWAIHTQHLICNNSPCSGSLLHCALVSPTLCFTKPARETEGGRRGKIVMYNNFHVALYDLKMLLLKTGSVSTGSLIQHTVTGKSSPTPVPSDQFPAPETTFGCVLCVRHLHCCTSWNTLTQTIKYAECWGLGCGRSVIMLHSHNHQIPSRSLRWRNWVIGWLRSLPKLVG